MEKEILKNEYKKLNELTNDDCKELDISKVVLRHNISKDYGDSYTCEMLVGPYHLKFKKNFNELTYFKILMCQRNYSQSNQLNVSCYTRWTKGISKNGSEYHQVQLIFGKDTFLTRMITDSELKLFNSFISQKIIKPIKWIDVPESLGIEENIDLDVE